MLRIFLVILFIIPSLVHAQIKGKIRDAETGQALSGAAIIFDGSEGMISGSSGNFTLPQMEDTLLIEISYLGYSNEQRNVYPGMNNIIIELVPTEHSLDEVVVAAPAFSSRLVNSTGSISIIPGSVIRESNVVNIASLINLSPGVYMASGSYNTNRLVIRGIGSRTPYGSNRIKAYFDEIPLTSGEGVSSLEDIDISGIGRIEILKGPLSSLYGSGLGGIVRIYPQFQSQKGLGITFQSEAASFGSFRNTLKTGFRDDDNSLSLIYNNTFSEGYRQNNEYSRNSLFLLGKSHIGGVELRISMNYIGLRSEIPSSVDEETFLRTPEAAAANWLNAEGYEKYHRLLSGVTASYNLSQDLVNKTSLFSTYHDPYEVRPFNILDEKSFSYGLRNVLSWQKKKILILLGFEIFRENYSWKIFEILEEGRGDLETHTNEKRNIFNGFFHIELKPTDKLIAEIGLNFNRLNYVVEELVPFDLDNIDSKSFSPLSPGIGLNYEVNKLINIFGSVRHGFSAPSVEESLLPDGSLNRDLGAEQGWNYDLGIRVKVDPGIYYELSLYYIDLKDLLITRRFTEEIFYGVNAGSANYMGMETFLRYSFSEALNLSDKSYSIILSYNTSKNRFGDFVEDDTDHSGNILPGIPDQQFSTRLQLRPFYALELLSDFNYTDRMYLNDENSVSYGAWNTFDLKLNYRVKLKETQLKFYAGVNNIFNQQYASMVLVNAPSFGSDSPRYYYPGLPVNYFFGLRIER